MEEPVNYYKERREKLYNGELEALRKEQDEAVVDLEKMKEENMISETTCYFLIILVKRTYKQKIVEIENVLNRL